MTQGINKQIRPLATIKWKCHFVNVGNDLLSGDAVPFAVSVHVCTLETKVATKVIRGKLRSTTQALIRRDLFCVPASTIVRIVNRG
jgi:hypothetical protein